MWLAKQKRLSVSIKDLLCQISMRLLALFSLFSLHFPLPVSLLFVFAPGIIHHLSFLCQINSGVFLPLWTLTDLSSCLFSEVHFEVMNH